MDWKFTPEVKAETLNVPYFEDAKADYTPYYSSTKKAYSVQNEINAIIQKLGGEFVIYREGHFGSKPALRYGYILEFYYHSKPSVIRVAGLPLRKPNPQKINQVKVQALCIVRDWLKSALTSMVFSPGIEPLLQFMLVDGRRTVADYIAETGQIPRLNPPQRDDFIEGTFQVQ